MSQPNRLNICFIPGGRGRALNFHFRAATVGALVVVALAALAFLSVYAFHAYRTRVSFMDRSNEVEALRATKAALEDQTATLVSALGALEERIGRLNGLTADQSALANEIKLQLGLSREATDDEVVPRFASAVAWAERNMIGGGDPEGQEGGSRYLIRNLNQEMERLMDLADQAEFDLTIINEGLSGTGSILAATPTILPINAPISSRYGRRNSPFGRSADFHSGLDIPVPSGTLVRAPADGTVLASGHSGGYGLLMTIDHGYGLVTRYGHLSSVLVEPGRTVHRGQPVARSGNSGRTTGPHLHYEVLLGGVPANPLEILAAVAPTLLQDIKYTDGAGGLDEAAGGASEP